MLGLIGEDRVESEGVARFYDGDQADQDESQFVGHQELDLAARSQAGINVPGRGAAEDGHDRKEHEQVHHDDQVAPETQPEDKRHPDQRRNAAQHGHGDQGGGDENPGDAFADQDRFLGKQFEKVAEILEERRPDPELKAGGNLPVDPPDQKAQDGGEEKTGKNEQVEQINDLHRFPSLTSQFGLLTARRSPTKKR